MEQSSRLLEMQQSSGRSENSRKMSKTNEVNAAIHRFPVCVVWTPLPCLTWLFPVIGHMGIATSTGVIRDFAGAYFVSEDDMGFGWPTLYWQLDLNKVQGGAAQWDQAVYDASEEYKGRMHNLFCDNCHSHVAMALNLMRYDGKSNWNMFTLAATIQIKGKWVGARGLLFQWLPFGIVLVLLLIILTPILVMGS